MWRWRVALACWMGMIFVLSSSLFAPKMSYDSTFDWFGAFNYAIRKCAHVVEYAVLCWLWFRSIDAADRTRTLILSTVLTLIYAMTDEWHQTFIPERSGLWSDIGYDAVGAVGMAFLIHRSWSWSPSVAKHWLVGEDLSPGGGQDDTRRLDVP